MDYLPCMVRKNYCNMRNCDFKCRSIDVWCDYSNERGCTYCEYQGDCNLQSEPNTCFTLRDRELRFMYDELISLCTVENTGYRLNSFISQGEWEENLKREKNRILKRIEELKR